LGLFAQLLVNLRGGLAITRSAARIRYRRKGPAISGSRKMRAALAEYENLNVATSSRAHGADR
jgi:hypothetical protein